MNFQNKRLIGIVSGIGLLLLIPFIAGFPWTALDYFAAAFLLLSTGLACEVVMRRVKDLQYKILSCSGILGTLVLLWAAIVSAE